MTAELDKRSNIFYKITFKNDEKLTSDERKKLLVQAFILDLKMNNLGDFRAFEKHLEGEKVRLGEDIREVAAEAGSLRTAIHNRPKVYNGQDFGLYVSDFAGHVQILSNAATRLENIFKVLAKTSAQAAIDDPSIAGDPRFADVKKTMLEAADGMGPVSAQMKEIELHVEALTLNAPFVMPASRPVPAEQLAVRPEQQASQRLTSAMARLRATQ